MQNKHSLPLMIHHSDNHKKPHPNFYFLVASDNHVTMGCGVSNSIAVTDSHTPPVDSSQLRPLLYPEKSTASDSESRSQESLCFEESNGDLNPAEDSGNVDNGISLQVHNGDQLPPLGCKISGGGASQGRAISSGGYCGVDLTLSGCERGSGERTQAQGHQEDNSRLGIPLCNHAQTDLALQGVHPDSIVHKRTTPFNEAEQGVVDKQPETLNSKDLLVSDVSTPNQQNIPISLCSASLAKTQAPSGPTMGYSLSKCYSIQKLQLQLGFISSITIN